MVQPSRCQLIITSAVNSLGAVGAPLAGTRSGSPVRTHGAAFSELGERHLAIEALTQNPLVVVGALLVHRWRPGRTSGTTLTAEAIEPLYGWNQQTIALLSLWGPLMYIVVAGPSSWLLDVGGLRAISDRHVVCHL